jgi:hypothetical protein
MLLLNFLSPITFLNNYVILELSSTDYLHKPSTKPKYGQFSQKSAIALLAQTSSKYLTAYFSSPLFQSDKIPAFIAPIETPTITSYAYSKGYIISTIAFKAPTSYAPLVPPPLKARALHFPSCLGIFKFGSILGSSGMNIPFEVCNRQAEINKIFFIYILLLLL